MPHATEHLAGSVLARSDAVDPASPAQHRGRPPSRLRSIWATIRAAFGVALGILPHVMHHVGLLAGAALLTGALGNGILYVVGLVLSIPLLRRLRAKFHSGWAPAIGTALFTGLFALSAFVIGPAIGGTGGPTPAVTPNPTPTPSQTVTGDGHSEHH